MSPLPCPPLAAWSWAAVDVVNHLWQSTVVAVALLLLMALCRRLSARTRLALGWMALLKFALPLAALSSLVVAIGGNPERWLQSNTLQVPASLAEAAFVPVLPLTAASSSETAVSRADAPLPSTNLPAGAKAAGGTPTLPLRALIVAAWLAGAGGLLAPWLVRARRLRRAILRQSRPVSPAMRTQIRAAAERAGVRILPPCLEVEGTHGPALLGAWSPVLIVPRGLEGELNREELESVLLHEFVHFRRRDSLWGTLQLLAIAVLWFNPVVWLIGRWIRLETEKSCDERVLAIMHDPDVYARGILKVVRHSLGLSQPLLVSVATPPVLARIRNILGRGSRREHPLLRLTVVLGGLSLMVLGGHAGSLVIAAPAGAVAVRSTPEVAAAPGRTAVFVLGPVTASEPAWDGRTVFRGTVTRVDAAPAPAAGENSRQPDPLALTREILPLLNRGDRDLARGARLFKDTGCAMCHAFHGSAAGIGPDLTGLGGRFGVHEILESIVDPSERISDLYGTSDLVLTNGRKDRGRLVSQDTIETSIVRNYTVDPTTRRTSWTGSVVRIPNKEIASLRVSETSVMPRGLIDRLSTEEVADLTAYLISAGDATHRLFRNFTAAVSPAPPAAPPAATASSTPLQSEVIQGWDGRTVFRGPLTNAMLAAPTPAAPIPPPAAAPPLTYIYNAERGSFEATVAGAGGPTVLAAAAGTGAITRNTVTVSFPNEDIRSLLRSVAELFELNLVLPEALSGRATVDLRNATWPQVFTTVLDPLGYTFLQEGQNIRVVQRPTTPVALESTELVVMPLTHIRAAAVAPTLAGMVDSAAGGRIQTDERTNTLIITGRPSQVARIQETVRRLDTAPPGPPQPRP